ncbi:MAG: recombinase family protein [bacterium]
METKAVSYCRVSSKEQEESGYSLPSQEKLLAEYANRKGLDVTKVFAVAESASGAKQRKIFSEMMEYMENKGISILLCEKVDRLSRNLKEAVVANDWIEANQKRQIHFVKQNLVIHKASKSDEKFRWDIEIVLAKKFISNLSEEVKKGQKEKISQGWLPTKPPLGYITTGDKGHKIHLVDTEKSSYIKKMFELYSTGNYSIPALVEVMYTDGFRNREGKKVGKSRLHDLLSDPFYCGEMKWNGQIYSAKHKPIITKELFDLVQEKMNRKFKIPRYQKHLPIFKAKIECEECNGTITWETQKGHWYGHCNHHKKCGQKNWWKQEKVEERIFPYFEGVAPKTAKVLQIIERAIIESHSDDTKDNSNSLIEVNRRIETSQRRLEAIYEDKIDGKISIDFYNKKFTEYTKENEEATKLLVKASKGNIKYYESCFKIHELASNASLIYKSPKATTEDKRLLLSKIFSNLSLGDDNITPEYTLAFKFLTEWLPVLNDSFEPQNYGSNKGKESTFVPSHPVLLRG